VSTAGKICRLAQIFGIAPWGAELSIMTTQHTRQPIRSKDAKEWPDALSAIVDLFLYYQQHPQPKQPRTLTGASVFFRSIDGATAHLLEDWIPDHARSEKGFHDQAQSFIRSRSPGVIIRRNANHNGGRPDLIVTRPGFVGGTVIIELKAHMRSVPECDRLVGQAVRYHEGGHKVLVVLCGRIRPHYVQEVRRRLLAQAPSLDEGSILLVDRTEAAIEEARRQEHRRIEANRRAAEHILETRRRRAAADAQLVVPKSTEP
jgi:hypothetical protein